MPEPDTTPDADRQARRDAIRDLITRVGRGRAGPDIATLLAGHLETEQADADQARAQRDTAAASLADLRNDLYAERAIKAEATLTAVRKAVAEAAECRLWERDNRQPCGQDHLARIEAALGDPPPATEPEPPTGERPRGTHLCHDTDPVTLKECALTHDHTGGHRDANTTWPPHCGESHIRDGKVWHCLQGPNHGGRHVGANGGLLRIQWPLPGEDAAAEAPAGSWSPRPCGEALWGSHGGHRYMLGGTGYQCPGGAVREQPAEPDWTLHLRRPCGEISPHPAHRYTRFPYVIDAETYGCPGVATPGLRTQPAEPLADAAAELADAYRAYLERRRAALAEAMRTVAAAFRAGGSE